MQGEENGEEKVPVGIGVQNSFSFGGPATFCKVWVHTSSCHPYQQPRKAALCHCPHGNTWGGREATQSELRAEARCTPGKLLGALGAYAPVGLSAGVGGLISWAPGHTSLLGFTLNATPPPSPTVAAGPPQKEGGVSVLAAGCPIVEQATSGPRKRLRGLQKFCMEPG